MANTNINYPCKKCLRECIENADAICCDLCLQWLHLSCSGLSKKEFKKSCMSSVYPWYCKYCSQDIFPFGRIGNITFNSTLTQTSNLKAEVSEYIKKNNFCKTCPICYKQCKNSLIPCHVCKCLSHHKCLQISLTNFKSLNDIKHWTCITCLSDTLPFQELANDELANCFLTPINSQTNATSMNLSEVRERLTHLNLINSDDDKVNAETHGYNCDYYHSDEFKKLKLYLQTICLYYIPI